MLVKQCISLLSSLYICSQVLAEPVDIKVGFLVGSQRLKGDQSYARPGRQLLHVFNYVMAKINKRDSSAVRFVPVVAETYGDEAESIKQTVDLIAAHRVNVIIGPQESCETESRLASVFNVPLVSYFCTPESQLSTHQSSFIQTKPPHWKIVERVALLIRRLLELPQWYPRQLALLYYRAQPPDSQVNGTSPDRTAATDNQASEGATADGTSTARSSNDALQYKLIGQLLEIELKRLLAGDNKMKSRASSLSVLNWHTTFHYGYTKNPFRQLVRRHLFAPNNDSRSQSSCGRSEQASWTEQGQRRRRNRATTYIVVGHYYEHLGLMLALDEFNQLAVSDQQQMRLQSSVPSNQQQQQQSVVIGVDIEQYDDRDDSVRFLRGLLMDESRASASGASSAPPDDRVDSIATMYRRYLGVVPSKPARMAEFLEGMRLVLYNNNRASRRKRTPTESKERSALKINQTSGSLVLTPQLLQFLRLPAEAFYLYDSVSLLAHYFEDCIQNRRLTVGACSEGSQMSDWFRNRTYTSSISDNQTKFDSQARAEGIYSVILRRLEPPSKEISDGEFGLVQAGEFLQESGEANLSLWVEADEIDPVWLPLWCLIRHSGNKSEDKCGAIIGAAQLEPQLEGQPSHSSIAIQTYAILLSALLCWLLLIRSILWRYRKGNRSASRSQSPKSINDGWFDETDEHNFLEIVSNFLPTSELVDNRSDSPTSEQATSMFVELHCHMFPFPSCKFVHWLTALHQLKEMMFQYQANSGHCIKDQKPVTCWCALASRIKQLLEPIEDNNRGFFTEKHKNTGSLRMLMHKYKSVNATFCKLSRLDHDAVVRLLGCKLSYSMVGSPESRTVQLMIERPDRGNIREAFSHLNEILGDGEDELESNHKFRSSLVTTIIDDILRGLDYLHRSELGFHGELRATTCLLTSDWRAKLSGFQTSHMRRSLGEYEEQHLSADRFDDLVYSAPEVLENYVRRSTLDSTNLRLADIYSFALLAYELLVGREPWTCLTQVRRSKLLVERVKVDSSFRPPLCEMDKSLSYLGLESGVIKHTIRSCWSHSPERRPQSIGSLRERLEAGGFKLVGSPKHSPPDDSHAVPRLYTDLLESIALRRKLSLQIERQTSHNFRISLLPHYVADRIVRGEPILSKPLCKMAFCQFKLIMLPDEQCDPIDRLGDAILQIYSLADSYHRRIQILDSRAESLQRFLVYSGEPTLAQTSNQERNFINDPCQLIASFTLQLIDLIGRWQSKSSLNSIQVKCGLHFGQVTGGLVLNSSTSKNSKHPQGDTNKLLHYALIGPAIQMVNILESSSLPQRAQISAEFRAQLLQSNFTCSNAAPSKLKCANQHGYVMIKREDRILAELEAFWLLNGPCLSASQSLMMST